MIGTASVTAVATGTASASLPVSAMQCQWQSARRRAVPLAVTRSPAVNTQAGTDIRESPDSDDAARRLRLKNPPGGAAAGPGPDPGRAASPSQSDSPESDSESESPPPSRG